MLDAIVILEVDRFVSGYLVEKRIQKLITIPQTQRLLERIEAAKPLRTDIEFDAAGAGNLRSRHGQMMKNAGWIP